jgi:hypothetical protein
VASLHAVDAVDVRPHGVRIPPQTLTTVLPVILTVVEMLLFDSTASANQFLGSVLTRTL